MKFLRSSFVVVGSAIIFLLAGFMLGNMSIMFIVWLVVSTIGVYQICREKKRSVK